MHGHGGLEGHAGLPQAAAGGLGDILVHALGGALDGVGGDKPEADLREGTATFPFLSCVKS